MKAILLAAGVGSRIVKDIGQMPKSLVDVNGKPLLLHTLELLKKNGMEIVGTSPDNRLVEAIEYTKNDFYVGVQFHPEFKSRPDKAHPIFREFITAATKVKRS